MDYLWGLVACVLMAYIFIEMNAVNSLLRVRSRMISSLFLLLMTACGFLHPFHTGLLVSLAVLIAIYFLFRTYDASYPQLPTFHAFLFFSLGSVLWPPLLLLIPLMLWNQGVFMRSLSLKTFGAAILGLLLPYMFLAVAILTMNDVLHIDELRMMNDEYSVQSSFINHHSSIIIPPRGITGGLDTPFSLSSLPRIEDFLSYAPLPPGRAGQGVLAALVFLLLLGLTGFIHYIRKSYDDKIHVRMKFYSLLAFQVATTLWLVLQPQHFYDLFPLCLITTGPAAAHFFTFARTLLSTIWCSLLTIALIAIAILNL